MYQQHVHIETTSFPFFELQLEVVMFVNLLGFQVFPITKEFLFIWISFLWQL